MGIIDDCESLKKRVIDGMCEANSDAALDEVPSGSLCEICLKKIDDLNGNPNFWGIAFPHPDSSGKMKYYHMGCITNIIAKYSAFGYPSLDDVLNDLEDLTFKVRAYISIMNRNETVDAEKAKDHLLRLTLNIIEEYFS